MLSHRRGPADAANPRLVECGACAAAGAPRIISPIGSAHARARHWGGICDSQLAEVGRNLRQKSVDGRLAGRWHCVLGANEHGLESAANIEIGFDPSYQKLTLHAINVRRGAQVIAKLTTAKVQVLQRESGLESLIFDGYRTAHVFLEDVRVGDVIEYAYTVRGSNPVFENHHFGGFALQYGVPLARLHARLLWPADRPIHWTRRNGAAEPTARETAQGREFRWDLHKVDARLVDADAPSWFDPHPVIEWSDFKDWAAVAAWAMPLYALPSPQGHRGAAGAGAHPVTPHDRISAAVAGRLQPRPRARPHRQSRVLDRPDPPAAARPDRAAGAGRPADYGRALVIDPATRGLVPMACPQARASVREVHEVHAIIDSQKGVDQPVRYTVTTTAHGAAADAMRSSLDSHSREELQKQYLNYYAGHFGELEVTDPMRSPTGARPTRSRSGKATCSRSSGRTATRRRGARRRSPCPI
jgi:Domain of Unknown Function with PDB structure (DUF3857)